MLIVNRSKWWKPYLGSILLTFGRISMLFVIDFILYRLFHVTYVPDWDIADWRTYLFLFCYCFVVTFIGVYVLLHLLKTSTVVAISVLFTEWLVIGACYFVLTAHTRF